MGLLLFVFGLLMLQIVLAADYCSVASCDGKQHVGCPIPIVPAQCTNFASITYNSEEQKEMVDAHNIKRNLVASGNAESKPSVGAAWKLPKATNMKTLVWDDELAKLASYNVLQCKMAHDACRNTDVYVGQNLYKSSFWGGSAPSVPVSTNIQGSIESWYKEINLMDLGQIKAFTGANGVGHFTQMVWAETSKVGCAGAKWSDGEWWEYLVACNYATGGNYKGKPVYNIGN